MPATARYSAATKELVAQLRALGYNVGCRALERYAELGLAPAPVRSSLGRPGTTSRYPEGALEQYEAVASVMRRGLDWRVAGLLLIGRGYLPVRESTFRLLMDFLFEDLDTPEDPLGRAEEELNRATGSRFFEKVTRIAKKNLSSVEIIDPVTGDKISAETVVASAMVWQLAALYGEPLPVGSAEEIAGVWGLIDSSLTEDERKERTRYVEAIYAGPLTFYALSRAARTIEPSRLQSAIRGIRGIAAEHPIDTALPTAFTDLMIIATGLMVTIIDDLGGLAWFRSMGVFTEDQ